VALLKALSEGRRSFRAMAVACGDGRECFPCGACRQMLAEFAPGLVLLLDAPEGMKKYALEELLPHRFIP
jgi:cytidine deaminase